MQGIVSAPAVELTGIFGTPEDKKEKCNLSWRLKGPMLIDEPLAPDVVASIYRAGMYPSAYVKSLEKSKLIWEAMEGLCADEKRRA